MGSIRIRSELCSGCRSCELSCSLKHHGYFEFAKSRIRVVHDEERSEIEIQMCIQCKERSCIAVCPTAALSIDDKTGAVLFDEKLCIHCRKCHKACAYNGVQWDYEMNVPMICDLCGGDPECLKPCRLHKALTPMSEEVIL